MKGNDKKEKKGAGQRISDARFSNFETDPRFRLPSKRTAKTKLDKRFKGMLEDEDFIATSRVDRYGRKLESDTRKKALQRLYEAEDDDEEDEDEDDDDDKERDKDKDDEQDSALDIDDDAVQRELLAVYKKETHDKYDPARGGGFSASEDESDSDDDDDDEDGGAELLVEGDMQKLQDEQAEVETGEVTRRIAIVNLDWDHVTSTDLYALFTSFIDDGDGRVVKVSVYPSEFGKERMQQEELEGPPKELFKQSRDDNESGSDQDSDEEEEDERIKNELIQEGDDQDFDSDALRKYQLDRLRYYYAVMECSDTATARRIYEATDGTEYQSSSNVIDLRFVPDDVEFDDDEPRDECTRLPDGYTPVEFVTTALQSSKVKLTWDLNPEEASRKDSIKRAFTGSRADLEENDLRAYLASETDESDGEEGDQAATFGGEAGDDDDDDGGGDKNDGDDNGDVQTKRKLTKKEAARQRMRAALGLGDEPAPKPAKGGPVGEMQVTFTPALSGSGSGKTTTGTAGEGEETTIEKYKRKERERKERKREKARARRSGADADEDSGGGGGGEGEAAHDDDDDADKEAGEDLGFDDPFFTADASAAPQPSRSSVRKTERLRKREARDAQAARDAVARAHLTRVMAADANEEDGQRRLDHFDMAEILRAEKKKKKKKQKRGDGERRGKNKGGGGGRDDDDDGRDGGLLQTGFVMDVGDERFGAVFESHEYAIDPSDPHFRDSEGMRQLLEEGRRRRREGGGKRAAGRDGGEGSGRKVKRSRL